MNKDVLIKHNEKRDAGARKKRDDVWLGIQKDFLYEFTKSVDVETIKVG